MRAAEGVDVSPLVRHQHGATALPGPPASADPGDPGLRSLAGVEVSLETGGQGVALPLPPSSPLCQPPAPGLSVQSLGLALTHDGEQKRLTALFFIPMWPNYSE